MNKEGEMSFMRAFVSLTWATFEANRHAAEKIIGGVYDGIKLLTIFRLLESTGPVQAFFGFLALSGIGAIVSQISSSTNR